MTPDELIPADILTRMRTALGASIVADVCTEQDAAVRADAAAFDCTEDQVRGWVRAKALHTLHALSGGVPEAVQKLFDAAEKQLDGLRKMSREVKANTAATPAAGVATRDRSHTRDDQDGL